MMRFAIQNSQSLSEKAKLILRSGKFISKSEFALVDISLYQIDDQHMEIWSDKSNGKIKKIDWVDENTINPFLKHLVAQHQN